MKKTISELITQLAATDDGKVIGGFLKVKGGFNSLFTLATNNGDCNNSATECTGDNTGTCTNTKNCTKTDNGKPACTNSQVCYY